MTFRVGILSLAHESNTFVSTPTTLEHFQNRHLLAGSAILDAYRPAHHEITGFIHGLEHHGITVVPIFVALASPGGIVTAQAHEHILHQMKSELETVLKNGTIDGFLAAPHGAGVSQPQRDMDGHWLAWLRETVGPNIPIIATLDLHANISQRMIDACNAVIAYRTNPHLDQESCGLQAAKLMAKTLRKEIRPVVAAAFPRVAINIERQLTSQSPCRELYAFADQQLADARVLSNSIALGFPYADVEEMGTSAIVVTDGDLPLAQQKANDIAKYIVDHRRDFVGEFIEISEAVDRAARTTQAPVCLLDMGDNVGGGGPGDGTLIAHELHRRNVGPSLVCFCDPIAQLTARAAGVGATLTLSLGGKTDAHHGTPLLAECTVIGLSDGLFHESQTRHGGQSSFNQGPTAVVRTKNGLTLLLSSRRMMPSSISQITSCGLNPADFRVLVAKGVHAPVAAYAPFCPTIIRVNTPGATCADMTKLTFTHRRRPLFPFEEIENIPN